MYVDRWMTVNPITINENNKVIDVITLMDEERIKRVLVVDNLNKLVGLITRKDLPFEVDKNALISTVMKTNIVTIHKNSLIEEAAKLMADQSVDILPILDGELILGLITKNDILKILIELLGARHYGLSVSIVLEDKPGKLAQIAQILTQKEVNIISIGSVASFTSSTAIVTMKLQDISKDEFISLVENYVVEVLYVKEI